jgi:hypothetical protein
VRRRLALPLLAAVLTMGPACSGGDDGGSSPRDRLPGNDESADTTATTAVPTTPTTPPPPVTVDACSLLSPDELTNALGAVPAGEAHATPPVFGCRWQTERLDLVSLAVVVYPDADTAEEAFDVARQNRDYPTIDNIGDRAMDASPVYEVTAQLGRYEVSVDVALAGAPEAAVAQDLARRALTRLPPG